MTWRTRRVQARIADVGVNCYCLLKLIERFPVLYKSKTEEERRVRCGMRRANPPPALCHPLRDTNFCQAHVPFRSGSRRLIEDFSPWISPRMHTRRRRFVRRLKNLFPSSPQPREIEVASQISVPTSRYFRRISHGAMYTVVFVVSSIGASLRRKKRKVQNLREESYTLERNFGV